MIKELLKKHNFVDSGLELYTTDTYIMGVDPFESNITMGTTTMWAAPNEFRVNLNTAVGRADVSQLILDNNGTLNITNRVQHIGSVFFDIETRELKSYDGTQWITIQQL
jgi:hypothetical protein